MIAHTHTYAGVSINQSVCVRKYQRPHDKLLKCTLTYTHARNKRGAKKRAQLADKFAYVCECVVFIALRPRVYERVGFTSYMWQ